jgi:hypothetical protein
VNKGGTKIRKTLEIGWTCRNSAVQWQQRMGPTTAGFV